MKTSTLFFSLLLFTISNTSCGLRQILPKKEVISLNELNDLKKLKADYSYSSDAMSDLPVIPFQIFGLTYEKDLVLVSKHPKWNMHEIAQIKTRDGDKWIIKDALENTLDQYILTDIKDINKLLPEINVAIREDAFEMLDQSTDQWTDIELAYINHLGEKVEIEMLSANKLKPLKKRNGSTMGHSKNQLLAILDLPERSFAKSASIKYDDQPYKIDKLLGIKKFQMQLSQTQGGISTGSYMISQSDENQFQCLHHNNVAQNWHRIVKDDTVELIDENELRSLKYVYTNKGNEQNLSKALVTPWYTETPSFEITFYPPLPDLRKQFENTLTSYFVMTINQQNHGTGTLTLLWQNDQLCIDINPSDPWWIEDRPMQSTINYGSENISVNTSIFPK